jgi:putative transposase
MHSSSGVSCAWTPSGARLHRRQRHEHLPTLQRYPTDVTDAERAIVAPLPPRQPRGPQRSPLVELLEVSIVHKYLLRTGCQWHMLFRDFLHRSAVRYCCDDWTEDGTLQRLNEALWVQLRTAAGSHLQPMRAASIARSRRPRRVVPIG